MKLLKATTLKGKCVECGFCRTYIACPGEPHCTGCGSCVWACPYEAKEFIVVETPDEYVTIKVDGEKHRVHRGITVLKALELIGFKVSSLPGEGDIYAPCRTGGCWACALIIDRELKPSCITPVRNGMEIITEPYTIAEKPPLRIVSSFQGHPVGGVGTPYWLKPRGFLYKYIEVACFAHGCILRCPSCQNWEITYSSTDTPLTPLQAAYLLTEARRLYGVDRMAISGGESTLNRRWLVQFIKSLKSLNRNEKARFHVDTNAVVLTPDYIDELVEAGMTDIGPDVKGLRVETFMKITGIKDRNLAQKMLMNEWSTVKYVVDKYWGKVFIGVGIPYNKAFMSTDELYEIGLKIASIEPTIQVCVLDYRPEFRAQYLRRPSFEEMMKAKQILEDAGLKTVVCQTIRGHILPGPQ
ncbi:MAG: radical SAM protein [Candidatus Nezhaarchaeota archaeon]|nr:radical SAM protein [Candidatus Nezhaarchaeota archaeon]MCX8142366.1 radical SAM protein [Candidatus Nezhaarchaeota archaeon]MDW8050661.1 radical SAM protein [Nitrososphaerota archaeon]